MAIPILHLSVPSWSKEETNTVGQKEKQKRFGDFVLFFLISTKITVLGKWH